MFNVRLSAFEKSALRQINVRRMSPNFWADVEYLWQRWWTGSGRRRTWRTRGRRPRGWGRPPTQSSSSPRAAHGWNCGSAWTYHKKMSKTFLLSLTIQKLSVSLSLKFFYAQYLISDFQDQSVQCMSIHVCTTNLVGGSELGIILPLSLCMAVRAIESLGKLMKP